VTCISTSSALDYYCRLGHPSQSTLKFFVPDLGHVSFLKCESCQLGKHYCVFYPNRVNKRADEPFDLVHFDVWGHYLLPSKLGFSYFINFVDDYSRVNGYIY